MGFILYQKKFYFIMVCFIIAFLATSFFLVGENKLDMEMESKDLQAFTLTSDEIYSAQSENFYRDLISNHNEDFFVLKTDALVQFSIQSWREEFEYEKYEVNGVNFFSFLHPKDLPFFTHIILEVIDEKEIHKDVGPFRLKKKSGQDILYLATIIPFFGGDGKIVALTVILHDLSAPIGDLDELDHTELTMLISLSK